MANQRRAGKITLNVNGVLQDAKGSFTYNLGRSKRDAIVGADTVHGFAEKPQVGFIEGAITDRGNLDLAALVDTTDATVTLELANGKVIALKDAWFAGEGDATTEEAEIEVRFEGRAEEVT